jgi:hypothetical protein
MNDPAYERWKDPCGQAAGERDPKKLVQLVAEINRLLEPKQIPTVKASTLAKAAGN